MPEQIILVDKNDNQIGVGEKMQVHQTGQLHRAFSILVFNSKGELLLQQRAKNKYHCPGIWANTCCSHPRVGEELEDAIHRRLQEEMGFDCPLKEIDSFIYQAKFDNGLTEHEYDHVFVGQYDRDYKFNPDEVEDAQWITMDKLKDDIVKNPDKYAPWFKMIIKRYPLS